MSLTRIAPLPDPTAARLFRTVRNARVMLQDRGYALQTPFVEDEEEFWARFGRTHDRHALTQLGVRADNETDRCAVFFPEAPATAVLRAYEAVMLAEGIAEAIIVVPCNKKRTPPSRHQVRMSRNKHGLLITLLHESELWVEVLRHHLVPQHDAITDADEKAGLAKRWAEGDQRRFLQLYTNDAVVQWVGMKAGDMVGVRNAGGSYLYHTIAHSMNPNKRLLSVGDSKRARTMKN